tara:strand:+ start:8411 stop:9046 length:636 start_codon:yes stop_codon:yes gene_type:complete
MKLSNLVAMSLIYSCAAPQVTPTAKPKIELLDPCPKTETFTASDLTKDFAITVSYNKVTGKMSQDCKRYNLGVAELISKDAKENYKILFHLEKGNHIIYMKVVGPFQDMYKEKSNSVACKAYAHTLDCKLESFFDPNDLSRTINNPFDYEKGMVSDLHISPCKVLDDGKLYYDYELTLQEKCLDQASAELDATKPAVQALEALGKLMQREK